MGGENAVVVDIEDPRPITSPVPLDWSGLNPPYPTIRPILMNATPAVLLPFPFPLVVLTTLRLRLLLLVISGLTSSLRFSSTSSSPSSNNIGGGGNGDVVADAEAEVRAIFLLILLPLSPLGPPPTEMMFPVDWDNRFLASSSIVDSVFPDISE
jgi:hypothetical protein